MSENKREKSSLWWFLPEIISIIVVLSAIVLAYFYYNPSLNSCVENGSFSVIILVVLGMAVRKLFPVIKGFENDAIANLKRFWIVLILGLVLSIVCVFIPVSAWPFTGLFVVLSVFSSPILGMLGGTALLIIATILTGAGSGILVLYLICGGLAISVFCPIKGEIKLFRPMSITLLGLFACLMTGIILSSDKQISYEQFLLPCLNLIITAIILFAGLRYYALKVQFSLRDLYQQLNDTEYHLLADAKENDKKTYKHSIHTSYFCERISNKLGMDSEALKCAGYYYRFCPTEENLREEFLENENFPGPVKKILTEYTDFISKRTNNKVQTRECAVLLCAQTVVVAVIALYEKDSTIKMDEQIDRIVDAAFSRYEKADVFKYSNLTFNDLNTMKEIFKGEKLYYDFLR